MLVLITVIAIKEPKKYDPLSPKKIVALGKLYLINSIIIIMVNSIKKAKSLFSEK